ncbi:MAG: 2-succinyl-5-enolpyruvyl-6-hydroxy-3-cyclohexene-1-carboxylic-acid synthase [Simkania sp.]|nr:2-succinyl-5-enolpyruvyl-6-hydroxy-3-cyclohexene-1-carboxylic-acid synthase [Simkania sp.]
MNNITWSKQIMSTLKASGVRYICLGPGSRSSPLIAAAAESLLEVVVHFDERGLGFLALGLSKVYREPVAIILTSGTAIGNVLPAIMEASHDDLPLIILSADRPPELRDCGANQTTDQVKIFGSFVRWQVDLPCAETRLLSYLTSTVSHAVALAKKRRGPVQINCMLREPLLGNPPDFSSYSSHSYEEGHTILSEERIEELASTLSKFEEGLVLLGQDAPEEATHVAKALQWPIISDVTSSLRGKTQVDIPYYEHLIKNSLVASPVAVLQFGRRLTSKTLMEFLKKTPPNIYYQIDDSFARFDPYHLVTKRFDIAPALLANSLARAIPQKKESSWLKCWRMASQSIEGKLETLLQGSYSEPGFAFTLSKMAPKHLFLSNSMPIRDAEAFFYSKSADTRIFTNRGLSGIDGNIATCIGIALTSQIPLLAVIGDLAFLHDLNSLAILQQNPLPILFLVINNRGGGIFSFLPHVSQTPYFETMVAYHHPYQFRAAADLFNIPYYAPTEHHELISLLKQFEQEPKMAVIELSTLRDENVIFHQTIENELRNCLKPLEVML